MMTQPAQKKHKPSDDSENGNGAGNVALQSDLYKVRFHLENQHKKSINSIKVSPDGTKFATCSSDCIIKVFDTASGRQIAELLGHTKGVSDIDFSPINNNILASCSDDLTIRLWSISNQKCCKILKKHTYHVTSIRFCSRGSILISGSADETITIWDIASGKTLRTLAAHSDPVSCLCLTPDDTIIISAAYDGLMRLFDMETGQCLKTLTYGSTSHGTATASTNDVINFPISYVEISPNGRYILSSSLNGLIRLWDYMDSKIIKTYSGFSGAPVSEQYICGTKFITKTTSPLIVSGSDSMGIIVWDVQTKDIVYNFKQNSEPILQVDLLNGGDSILACSKDGSIHLLDLQHDYAADYGHLNQTTPL